MSSPIPINLAYLSPHELNPVYHLVCLELIMSIITTIFLISPIFNLKDTLNNSYATPLFGLSVPLSTDFGLYSPQIAASRRDENNE